MYPIRTAKKYDPSDLVSTARIYTTVYLGTYIEGDYLEWNGSHLGVDIIPMSPHDTVSAVLDGVVTIAANNAMNGNYVVIRHDHAPDPEDLSKTETLYSIYLHMDSLSIETGAIVSEGTPIGKTGSTGNSSGEHLHFQIDRATAPYHPYWPFTTAEASAAGYGYFEAVNAGLGLDNARAHTINPLVYLDRVASSGGSSSADPDSAISGSSASATVSTAAAHTTPVSVPDPTPIAAPEPAPIIAAPEPAPIAVSPIANTSSSDEFSDVSSSYAYHDAIISLKKRGVVSGNDGKFYPDHNISRVELLKMVFLAGNITAESSGTSAFSDVDNSAWYAAYVNTAKNRGIVGGYEDGTFRPNNPLTRAEGLKIICNTLAPGMSAGMSGGGFTDIEIGAWYGPYAELAKRMNLMNFSGSTFAANKFITRWEVASVIAGLSKK